MNDRVDVTMESWWRDYEDPRGMSEDECHEFLDDLMEGKYGGAEFYVDLDPLLWQAVLSIQFHPGGERSLGMTIDLPEKVMERFLRKLHYQGKIIVTDTEKFPWAKEVRHERSA